MGEVSRRRSLARTGVAPLAPSERRGGRGVQLRGEEGQKEEGEWRKRELLVGDYLLRDSS